MLTESKDGGHKISAHPTKDSAIFRIARVTRIATIFANPPYKGKQHLLMCL